jgi:hypothetical protein
MEICISIKFDDNTIPAEVRQAIRSACFKSLDVINQRGIIAVDVEVPLQVGCAKSASIFRPE